MGGATSSLELGGVRVFKVVPGSPAAEAGLEVFFDFILEVNGSKLDDNSSQQSFAEKIAACENQCAKLTVYNTRSQKEREVAVTPRKWHGTGLLGATVRYDVVDPAENHGIRVLEVFPNSPAAHAGMVPFQDFLMGTAQVVFHDIDELVEAVTSNINQRMQLYVYNADSEAVREVTLVPNNDWGGEGCIGCDIGTGLLHKIPAPRRTPGAIPRPAGPVLPCGVPVPGGMPAISPTGAWTPVAEAGAAFSPPPSLVQHAGSAKEIPAAPPGTPMNPNEVPTMDPDRFAGVAQRLGAEVVQPPGVL